MGSYQEYNCIPRSLQLYGQNWTGSEAALPKQKLVAQCYPKIHIPYSSGILLGVLPPQL